MGICAFCYVRHMGCNSVAWIYGQLAGGPSDIGICACCYMLDLWGVTV